MRQIEQVKKDKGQRVGGAEKSREIHAQEEKKPEVVWLICVNVELSQSMRANHNC